MTYARKKTPFLLFVLTLLALAVSVPQVHRALGITDEPLPNETEVNEVIHQWSEDVSTANIEALETLLNEQYMHIHATAKIENKMQFIDALKTHQRVYGPIKLEDKTIRLFGTTAIVTGKFKLHVVSAGKVIEGFNQVSITLVMLNGKLEIISFQATPIQPL